MTKAVRLGFDTVRDVFRSQRASMDLTRAANIESFCVTGASKRGWTTWTIASVDKRVKCAIPVVLDCLNMRDQPRVKYRNRMLAKLSLDFFLFQKIFHFHMICSVFQLVPKSWSVEFRFVSVLGRGPHQLLVLRRILAFDGHRRSLCVRFARELLRTSLLLNSFVLDIASG